MRKLVAGRRRVAGPVHGFDDHCVYALGLCIDEVLIHPGGDGQGTHDTVYIDLVLNGVLGIHIVGGLRPANIELPAAIVGDKMQVGWRCRRYRVAARLRRQGDLVAERRGARRGPRLNGEYVRGRWCEMADVDRPFTVPVYVRCRATIHENLVG